MRIVLIIIIGFHGIIHLFGFLKAFELANMEALTQSISKPFGILWLLVFVLFITTLGLFLFNNNYWWLFGIISILLSQFLIVQFWTDAKFGTIANIIISFAIIIGYGSFNFAQKVNVELSQMYSNMESSQDVIVSKLMFAHLPLPVQNWLDNSGIVGNEKIQSIYLKQKVSIKMKPEQKDWYNAEAEQYSIAQPPAFNWVIDLQINPLMKVVGRDKFENGKGEMFIKVLSLFPVGEVKENEKVNQAALQRYLAEIVWFPSAALSKYITWESIDEYSARATMNYNGTKGSGIFSFNKNGDFIKFSAMRYKDIDENAQLKEWLVEVTKSNVINGIKIPVEIQATWKLEDEDWTWLKLKITELQYNIEEIPVPNKL